MSDKRYLRCYVKDSWTGQWVLDRHLSPTKITLAAGSAGAGTASGAELVRVWGAGVLEEGTPIVDGMQLESYVGNYVKITRSGEVWGLRERGEGQLTGAGEETLFVGYRPAEQFSLLGYSDMTAAASVDHGIRAVGLDDLLDRRMLWSYVYGTHPESGEIGAVRIQWLPTFNRKVRSGGVAGNRTAEAYMIDSINTYIFDESSTAEKWSLFDVLAYLLRYQALYPPIQFEISDELRDVLLGMEGVYDFSRHTLRQAISQIVHPARGMNWRLKIIPGEPELVRLHIYSLLPEAMTVGDVSLSAHDADDRMQAAVMDDDVLEGVSVTRDAGARYDHIVVRGGPIRTCCTFSYKDGLLVAGWPDDDETAYKDAAEAFDTDYAAADADEKVEKNDAWRGSDRMGRVYTAFPVWGNWGWITRNYSEDDEGPWRIVNPLWNVDTAQFEYERHGPCWLGQKAFESFLPFRQGYDYDAVGGEPVNHNDAQTKPELRKFFALVKRDGRWWYADRMEPFSAHVAPLVDELGARVRFRPNHLFGVNHFSGAEPSKTDDILDEGRTWDELGADWEDLIVTGMVETDQRLQVEWGSEWAAEGKPLVIEMPAAEIWHVVEGTIYGLNNVDPAAGDPFKRVALTEAGRLLRDDSGMVKDVLASAVAWYGRERYKVEISSQDLTVIPQVGTMLEGFTIGPDVVEGSCVSVVQMTFAAGRWRYVVRTDVAQLDFGAVAGMHTEDQPSTIRRQQRDVEAIKERVQDLEVQVATGLRDGGLTAGAIGRGGPRRAFVKTTPGATTSVVVYLDTDGTGIEVTVSCYVYGGGNCNAAYPTLVDGMPLWVINDNGTWRNVTSIYKIGEECT